MHCHTLHIKIKFSSTCQSRIISNSMLLLALLKSSHRFDKRQMGSNGTSANQYDKWNEQVGTHNFVWDDIIRSHSDMKGHKKGTPRNILDTNVFNKLNCPKPLAWFNHTGVRERLLSYLHKYAEMYLVMCSLNWGTCSEDKLWSWFFHGSIIIFTVIRLA
jgi:hypothetical protein